jgi:hypothetical protein
MKTIFRFKKPQSKGRIERTQRRLKERAGKIPSWQPLWSKIKCRQNRNDPVPMSWYEELIPHFFKSRLWHMLY